MRHKSLSKAEIALIYAIVQDTLRELWQRAENGELVFIEAQNITDGLTK